MRAIISASLGLSVLLAASACTQQAFDPNPTFGDATGQNAATMIIDPQPPQAQDTDLPLEGHRALLGMGRYQTGTTIPPQTQNTTAGPGGGQ
jgi:hypothetical protein